MVVCRIDHAYTAEDAMKFPRMTVEETVQKIVGLLDAAASVLPWQVNADNDGRMTAASALALKVQGASVCGESFI